MNSSFLQKYEWKIVRISTKLQGRNPDNLFLILRNDDFINPFWNYWSLQSLYQDIWCRVGLLVLSREEPIWIRWWLLKKGRNIDFYWLSNFINSISLICFQIYVQNIQDGHITCPLKSHQCRISRQLLGNWHAWFWPDFRLYFCKMIGSSLL